MIIVISQKSGGVGKSCTAVHLADYLANRKGAGTVALVDADANETCLDWAAAGPGPTFDVFSSDSEIGSYDHLIIDTAAAPDSEELTDILESADLLIAPTTPSPWDVSPAIATVQVAKEIGIDTLVLLTLCPPKPSTAGEVALSELQTEGLPMVPQVITRRNCYLQAAIDGVTVREIKSTSAKKGWEEWKAVGRFICKGRL